MRVHELGADIARDYEPPQPILGASLKTSVVFRADLFHRLNGMSITVPPLRERPNDLRVLLADGMARAAREQGKPIEGLAPDAVDLLLAYEWPGNLRELAKVTEAAVALCDGEGAVIARGLTNYSSADVERIKGLKSEKIAQVLGRRPYAEVIHRDNLAIVQK